ncbi:MAG: hypothetical protein NVV63_04835 [Opitutus sp.]|nr:hypothetical protein [Opitutus sp.]
MSVSYFVAGAVVLSLVLMQINARAASPMLSIADRWLRWLIFSLGGAELNDYFEWIDRPYPVVATTCFLVWFVLETAFNWMRIHALSVSPLPLFPHYELNQEGDEWPIQPRLLRVREWLRAQGFKQVQALKAEIGGGIFLRVSVFQDAEAMTRVHVTFIPQASGAITVCYSFTSLTVDGCRFVTDNLYVPFAGFYPEAWFVERSPWRRSAEVLLKRHRARLNRAGATLVPFDLDPLTDQNSTQQELDRLNTELGFLHSPAEREDHGKITQEGRYRVWKEIWMLNYLGRAMRYD